MHINSVENLWSFMALDELSFFFFKSFFLAAFLEMENAL